ncbi:MAG: flagellar hook capping protein [Lachnospiraceae bacterium]|nr:flagellar hook capping protein [Lachnospiraceae bacterium]MDE7333695.1 flagellar hook capping protein [Lachnospiraceae bacterium]
MAVTGVVQDGKVLETASESSVKKAAAKNGMDKDAFLQLLVAQMKYQDPLEPTSNTEYISQYATFSQVEQMQNMAATMELTRASSMVGKLVAVETTDSSGNARQIQGTVEYVTYENGKAFVSVGNALYSVDDVIAVIDQTYQTAYDMAVAFCAAMDKLPRVSSLTPDDKEAVETLQKAFNSMTTYQQSFISDDYIKALQEYVARMAELVGNTSDGDGSDNEEGGSTEGSGTEGGGEGSGSEGGSTDAGAAQIV